MCIPVSWRQPVCAWWEAGPEATACDIQVYQEFSATQVEKLSHSKGSVSSHCSLAEVYMWAAGTICRDEVPSRPVLPFCPFWLHTFISLNSPELHCWLSSHPHCIKMLGLCFRVHVCRSQGAGTDPAKDSMPSACRRGQGLPSDPPKDSLCLHLVVIDCKFVVRKVFGMTLPKTACPGHAIVS